MTRAARIGVQALILLIAGLLLAWRFSVIQQRKPDVPPAVQAPAPTEPVVYNIEPIPDEVSSPGANQPPLTGMSSSVSGRVYDAATAMGLRGIRVSARRQGGDRDIPATTDDKGMFALPDLSAGNWQLQLNGPGLPPGEHLLYVSLRAGEDREAADFPLAMGLTVSGVVIDPAGKIVEGASVQCHGERDVNHTTTDSQGTFTLVGLKAGAVISVVASKEGYGPTEPAEVALGDKSVEDLRLKLHYESSISGTVVDEQGRPVTDAFVHAELELGGRVGVMAPNDDADGRFQIDGLGPGAYNVRAQRVRRRSDFSSSYYPRRDVTLAVVELREGQHEQGLRLVLPDDGIEDAIVSGTVTKSDGTPLAEAHVVLQNSTYMGTAETDARGQFSISLPLGTYTADVGLAGYAWNSVPEIHAPSREIAIVLDHVGRIHGAVFDAATRRPITQFAVAKPRSPAEVLATGNLELVPHFDARGIFFAAAAEFRSTRLAVVAPGYALLIRHVDVPPGETVDVEFPLEPGAMLRGVVLDAQDVPVRGAQVFLGELPRWLNVNTGAPDHAATFTGLQGEFVLESLPLNIAGVSAFLPGHQPGTEGLRLHPGENGPVTIHLASGTTVTGVVTYAGTPVAGAYVVLQLDEPAQRKNVTTGVDGTFRLDALLPGSGSIGVILPLEGDANYQFSRRLDVALGAPSHFRFNLAAVDTVIRGQVTGIPNDATRTEVGAVVEAGGEQHSVALEPDDDGQFVVSGLPAGLGTVNATTYLESGEESVREDVVFTAGREISVTLDFDTLIRVSGTVGGWQPHEHVEGALLRGAITDIPTDPDTFPHWLESQDMVDRVNVGADGRFFFSIRDAGSYTLLIGTEGSGSTTPRLVSTILEARSGETIELELYL